MLIQAIAVFGIVVAAQVLLVAKAADMLSSFGSTPRDGGALSTGRAA